VAEFLRDAPVQADIACAGLGCVRVELSYQVSHPIRLFWGSVHATHTAPIVEEVFKSLILLYLVRRANTTFFVDGAVYGFAAGIGFAIAENMLYLSRLDADASVVVATSRAFLALWPRQPDPSSAWRRRIPPRAHQSPALRWLVAW